MQVVKENCAVCWRDFSTQVKPISLSCGHSYCNECSGLLKKCPLCRMRLIPASGRPTNYSLLSLIEKTDKYKPPEVKNIGSQTEENQVIIGPRRSGSQGTTRAAFQSGNQRKKDAVKFKFTRNATGCLEGFEIQMN